MREVIVRWSRAFDCGRWRKVGVPYLVTRPQRTPAKLARAGHELAVGSGWCVVALELVRVRRPERGASGGTGECAQGFLKQRTLTELTTRFCTVRKL